MPVKLTGQFKKNYKKLKKTDAKLRCKLMDLIMDVARFDSNPLNGMGKPEKLKHLSNVFSRRINKKHRLTYTFLNDDRVAMLSCYGHYSER